MGSFNPEGEVAFVIETNEWDTMSDYEKRSCINRLQNYNVMKALGFDPDLPEFLGEISPPKRLKNNIGRQKKKLKREENEESSLNISAISLLSPKNEINELNNETEPSNSLVSDNPDIIEPREQQAVADKDGLLRFSEEEISEAVRCYNVFSTVLNVLKSYLRKRKFRKIRRTRKVHKHKGKKVQKHIQDIKPTPCTGKKKCFDNRIDELFFCDICNNDWDGVCPVHGALLFMGDNHIVDHGLIHALYTTPLLLAIGTCQMGFGVWARCAIPPMVLFGPYTGEITSKPDDFGYSWQIMKNGQVSYYISGLNVYAGNWMRYVKLARFEEEVNLLAFQYKGDIYYRSFKQIPPQTELKVWFVNKFGRQLARVSHDLLSGASLEDYLN